MNNRATLSALFIVLAGYGLAAHAQSSHPCRTPAECQARIDQIDAEINARRPSTTKLRSEVDALKTQEDDLKAERQRLIGELAKNQAEREQLEQTMRKAQEVVDRYGASGEKYRLAQRKMNEIQRQILAVARDIDRLKEALAKINEIERQRSEGVVTTRVPLSTSSERRR